MILLKEFYKILRTDIHPLELKELTGVLNPCYFRILKHLVRRHTLTHSSVILADDKVDFDLIFTNFSPRTKVRITITQKELSKYNFTSSSINEYSFLVLKRIIRMYFDNYAINMFGDGFEKNFFSIFEYDYFGTQMSNTDYSRYLRQVFHKRKKLYIKTEKEKQEAIKIINDWYEDIGVD